MGKLCMGFPPPRNRHDIFELLHDIQQVLEVEELRASPTKSDVTPAGLPPVAANALEMTLAKVREGVGPASIEEGALAALGQGYCAGFASGATQPEKWRLLSEDVFRKARLVGALGAFISEWEAGRNGIRTGAPTVSFRHLSMAGWVARAIDHGRLPVEPNAFEEETT